MIWIIAATIWAAASIAGAVILKRVGGRSKLTAEERKWVLCAPFFILDFLLTLMEYACRSAPTWMQSSLLLPGWITIVVGQIAVLTIDAIPPNGLARMETVR